VPVAGQIALLSAAFALRALAAEQDCDPSLPRDPGYAMSYQQRGDRCEGVYIRKVSESSLQIASFTGAIEPFDPKSVRSARLFWNASGPDPVHLRAVSLVEKLYYRMDSVRPSGDANYDWPTDILSALRLYPSELGLLSWSSRPVQGENHAVYLPVSIGNSAGPGVRYNFLVVSGANLQKLFMSLTALRPDGSPEHSIFTGESVRDGYWPAHVPLKVSLPVLKRAGLYYLELGATLNSGGSAATEMWFYHAGERAR
jgi:hypothetical protein